MINNNIQTGRGTPAMTDWFAKMTRQSDLDALVSLCTSETWCIEFVLRWCNLSVSSNQFEDLFLTFLINKTFLFLHWSVLCVNCWVWESQEFNSYRNPQTSLSGSNDYKMVKVTEATFSPFWWLNINPGCWLVSVWCHALHCSCDWLIDYYE